MNSSEGKDRRKSYRIKIMTIQGAHSNSNKSSKIHVLLGVLKGYFSEITFFHEDVLRLILKKRRKNRNNI
jgi:hypothetical protein